MNNCNFELSKDLKLSSSNYLQWKPCIKNLLMLFGYYYLITRTETDEESTAADKLDPRQREKALAILCLNCNVKIANQFILESNDDPSAFWEVINKSFSPSSVQSQTRYLNKIFSFDLSSGQIDNNIKDIMTITQNLCSLIDKNNTKPSILIDSMIAIPSSLKNLWEEFCLYTQRKSHKANNNSSALFSIQGNPTFNPLNALFHQSSNQNHSSTPFNPNVS
ncbi:hypothetical protein O181_080212 [Austropuccinia psidii MF-1]|uniref:Uncharacterized protein n=1 Tax=Austropuccinia psidii MF-1 TaxID=1389203 RepID=A0A9Q3FNH3_9BASI|nr:hypothetical protein [Austropuccinia psidii MF-1]